MSEITIRKVRNGYIVSVPPVQYGRMGDAQNALMVNRMGHYSNGRDSVFATFDEVTHFLSEEFGEVPVSDGPKTASEQPQTPAPQSSEGGSTEAVRPFATHLSEDGVPHWEDMTSEQIKAHKAAANGTTHPEQQD